MFHVKQKSFHGGFLGWWMYTYCKNVLGDKHID